MKKVSGKNCNKKFILEKPRNQGNRPNPLSGDKLLSDCDKIEKVQEGEKGDHETGREDWEDQEEDKEGEVEKKWKGRIFKFAERGVHCEFPIY